MHPTLLFGMPFPFLLKFQIALESSLIGNLVRNPMFGDVAAFYCALRAVIMGFCNEMFICLSPSLDWEDRFCVLKFCILGIYVISRIVPGKDTEMKSDSSD